MKYRPSFQDIYIVLADLLSRRSDCTRASVGAVVTDERGTQVYGVGYNGGAAGDVCRCSGEPGNCGCVHAEANALIKCRTQDTSKVLYTTTFPCKTCAKLIVNSGFTRIFYLGKHRDWQESEEILRNGKVTTYHMVPQGDGSYKAFATLLPLSLCAQKFFLPTPPQAR